jgi:hypothetical protein
MQPIAAMPIVRSQIKLGSGTTVIRIYPEGKEAGETEIEGIHVAPPSSDSSVNTSKKLEM